MICVRPRLASAFVRQDLSSSDCRPSSFLVSNARPTQFMHAPGYAAYDATLCAISGRSEAILAIT